MRLCKVQLKNAEIRVGALVDDQVRLLDVGRNTLSDILHAEHASRLAHNLIDDRGPSVPTSEVTFLAPVDQQEIWAAGVTYKRSQEARERESVGAARFYDLVYTAPRPELFFKANAPRVSGPGQPVHVRRDSRWSVPEPELALVISPRLRIVGFTIGNDMSARDIEGENPLYLPQAKVYDRSCSIGPVITLAEAMPPLADVSIRLLIERSNAVVFDGSTSIARMARPFDDLVEWLGRENSFPQGVVLLTGTGIVPPDDFSLAPNDQVHIDISGVGRLSNPVAWRE